MKNSHVSEIKMSAIIFIMVCELQSVLLVMTAIPGRYERQKERLQSYVT